MPADINALLADAKCFTDLDERQLAAVQIALLGQILGGTMPEINTLLADGKCFMELDHKQQMAVMLQLLALILAGGGGGGGGVGLIGTGSPEGVVTASPGQVYTDKTSTDNPGFWVKITGTGNTGWVNILTEGP